MGQFLSYRLVLSQIEPNRALYLAIPLDTYLELFESDFGELVMKEYELKLIIYNSNNGDLTQWIN